MEFLVSERVRGMEPTAFGEQLAQRSLPNGTTLEIRYSPMPDGGFVCVYSDITDQEQAESLRRESETERGTQIKITLPVPEAALEPA